MDPPESPGAGSTQPTALTPADVDEAYYKVFVTSEAPRAASAAFAALHPVT